MKKGDRVEIILTRVPGAETFTIRQTYPDKIGYISYVNPKQVLPYYVTPGPNSKHKIPNPRFGWFFDKKHLVKLPPESRQLNLFK